MSKSRSAAARKAWVTRRRGGGAARLSRLSRSFRKYLNSQNDFFSKVQAFSKANQPKNMTGLDGRDYYPGTRIPR